MRNYTSITFLTWPLAKKKVDNLSANYKRVIDDYLKNDPSAVKIQRKNAGTIYTVNLGFIYSHECELQVRDHKSKGVIEAQYYLWNNPDSVCYLRDLLNPTELSL